MAPQQLAQLISDALFTCEDSQQISGIDRVAVLDDGLLLTTADNRVLRPTLHTLRSTAHGRPSTGHAPPPTRGVLTPVCLTLNPEP